MRGNTIRVHLQNNVNTLLKTRRNLSSADLRALEQNARSDYGEILHSQRLGIVEQWNVFFQNDLQDELLP